MNRSGLLILSAAALSVLAPLVHARSAMKKPMRLIVPFPPGGAAEQIGRVLAQKLGPILAQTVIVDAGLGSRWAVGGERFPPFRDEFLNEQPAQDLP